jgi:hypothetical protein
MALTKEAILGCKDLKVQKIDIPEWGGEVFVRVMSGSQRDALEAELRKPTPSPMRGRVAAYTICDEAGELLFNEKDIPALEAKSYSALDRVLVAATALNEMTEASIEELKKTLRATRSGGSCSA